jgi:MFS family permease
LEHLLRHGDLRHLEPYTGSASALMNAAGAVAGILSPVMFGWILDRTGSWTTPFTVSLGLLLLGAVMTYWFRPDRPLDTIPSVARLTRRSARYQPPPEPSCHPE